MSKFNPERHRSETASALKDVIEVAKQERHPAYVGPGVHKETIAVAAAEPGRGAPVYRGVIANRPKPESLTGSAGGLLFSVIFQID